MPKVKDLPASKSFEIPNLFISKALSAVIIDDEFRPILIVCVHLWRQDMRVCVLVGVGACGR